MVALNLVAPVTAALIKSAFRRPSKDKLIIVKDGKVSVVVPDDDTNIVVVPAETEETR
jgi:hypothetical protein